ncbi:MAG: hypothetical protein ABR612_01390 [Chromatocurvus sp.]
MPENADPHSTGSQRSGAAGSNSDSGSGASAGAKSESAGGDLQAWLALGGQAFAVIEQLATVLRLELGLAVADTKRLLIVVLAMIPLVLLAWLGFCALLAWLAVVASHSVTLGLATFLLLQLGSLYLLARAARRFQSSLGLPVSRRHLRALMKNPSTGSGEPGQKK